VREFILVRHASAGRREEWSGSDRLRPLDDRGRRQAEGLIAALAAYPVERILTSPSVRCTETVLPLAEQRGLEVEERLEVAEGASRESALALVGELEGPGLVVCTHGDVVEELLGEGMKKGEARILVREPGTLRTLARIRPPA
jgi:phosphohistidine phosphatase SixA